MNTIRSFFTATIVFLVVAIGGIVVSSMDNIVWAWKCCPVDQLYDPKVRFCRPVADGNEYDQRLKNRLGSGFRVASNATLKSYKYRPPYCGDTKVLVDVPIEEVRMLMEGDPSPITLPLYYCFDLTPSDELVARTCRPRDQYCGRDNNMCVRKCCPVNRLYDPKVRFCRPVGADGDEHDQRLMDRLGSGFRVATNATLKSYNFGPLYCDDDTEVLVDVPTEEVRMLMEADPSPIELPLNYCFDLTPSDELVARTCRPRDQYCGRGNYTCVSKCCPEGYILVNQPDYMGVSMCKYSEIPFQFSAYETDVGGSPVGLSNNKVLPYQLRVSQCSALTWIYNRVTLTTNGNLHVIHEGVKFIITTTNYCIDYHAKDETTGATDLMAYVCSKPPVISPFWFKTLSVVCLVLTMIVYATLPYLRNAHGYYVMFYMACQLVYFVFDLIYDLVLAGEILSPLCIPFGYFAFFATLTTCCWLNVICFDIYWMLRYNNSINRNTSKSVRTIMYHIYCWGFSSICVSTGYLFQHSQNETLQKLSPGIGIYKCHFSALHDYGDLIFYMVPTCGMLTANLILFLRTVIHCSRIKSELNKFRRTDSKIEMFLFYKEKFVMSIKLFLVFGMPFLFFMLSQLFKLKGIKKEIINAINDLQGVYIFIIFVAKSKVIMDLRKKFQGSMDYSEVTQMNNISGSS